MYQDYKGKDVGNNDGYQPINDDLNDRETYRHTIRSVEIKEAWTTR